MRSAWWVADATITFLVVGFALVMFLLFWFGIRQGKLDRDDK